MFRYRYWIASLLFAGLVGAKFDSLTGFTSLIRFGETWQNRRHTSLQRLPISTVSKSNGYDGQFYAQIALDPLLKGSELPRIIDAPSYRAHRILAPLVAWIAGCGNPWWVIQVYALINIVCWAGLGWVLCRLINGRDWIDFARWVGCMFSVGILDSVRQSLVDLPALLLLVAAIWQLQRSRPNSSTLCLALGGLAKETTLLGAIALSADSVFLAKNRLWTACRIALVFVPTCLWWLYVDSRLGTEPSGSGLGNLTRPFAGLVRHTILCVTELGHANLDGRYLFGLLAVVGIIIQSISIWRASNLSSPWWRIGVAYSILIPFLSLWVWSGYWAACRAVLPLTISFNLLLPANRSFWPLWIAGNLTILHGLWRFL